MRARVTAPGHFVPVEGPSEAGPLLAHATASGEFTADDEVDETAWLDLAAARKRLTYEHDRALLDVVSRLV